MDLEVFRQVVQLNEKISDNNDRLVHEFQNLVIRLEAGRENMMRNASKLKGLKRYRGNQVA